MERVERHFTKTEVALRALRTSISNGSLSPGERLGIRELTEELGMSPTPVREALRLLQADGLVAYRPHHGMVVAAPSLEQISDIYRMRKVLEPLATEWAVPQLTDDDRPRLSAHHAELIRAVERGNLAAAVGANAAWHWALYELSGSKLLVSFIQRLWDAAPWRTAWIVRQRPEQLNKEHVLLDAAVGAGEAAEAARLMRTHIEYGEQTLIESMRRADNAIEEQPPVRGRRLLVTDEDLEVAENLGAPL